MHKDRLPESPVDKVPIAAQGTCPLKPFINLPNRARRRTIEVTLFKG